MRTRLGSHMSEPGGEGLGSSEDRSGSEDFGLSLASACRASEQPEASVLAVL